MILFIVILALSLLFIYLKTEKRCNLAEKFPGPQAHPIFGNIFNFFSKDLLIFKQRIFEAHQTYGEIFRLKFMRSYLFYVSDLRIVEHILSSSTNYMQKASHYKFISMLLGNGLVTSSGEHWQNHRKIIMPAFNYTFLKDFIAVFDRHSQIFVDKLRNKADGNILNIGEYVNLMTLDIILETAMGTSINAQINEQSEYVEAVERSKSIMTERISSIWRRVDLLYSTLFYKEKQEQDRIYRIVHDFSNKIITKRREILTNENSSGFVDFESVKNHENRRGKSVFIDVLLGATINGKPLTNEEILDETHTFMTAGHDTTASALSAVLFLLSRNKTAQDKLYAEIISTVGKKNEQPTYQKLQSFKYMDMVIKESMRLYPPIPLIGRYMDQDLKLDDGRIIPAGVDIRLNFSLIFTSAKYFKDPKVFLPERFDIDRPIHKIHPFAFTPFSSGARNCIGQKFAILSIKTALIKILQNFELVPAGEEPIISFEVVSRAVNGMQMALKPRLMES